jgi:uncharacterized protein (TIGR03435 family)
MFRAECLFFVAGLVGISCYGQASSTSKLEFEVATIKPLDTPKGGRSVTLILNHGTARVEAATLRQIIVQAYAVQRVRVIGGPDWYNTEQYDVVAKAENPDATRDQVRQMLQALLADRFKLMVHHETREIPMYSLMVAKGGPKFAKAKPDEPSAVTPGTPGTLVFQEQGMLGLVNTLANMLDMPVDDMTNLAGAYDFTLEWFPPDLLRQRSEGVTPPARPDPREYLPEAVDRLGLKLQPKKGSTEVLVVDHAERVSPN